MRFYLSSDTTLDAADVLLRERGVARVRPGKERRKNLGTVVLAPGSSVTGKFVIAVADATGLVVESDERNNATASLPIATP